MGKKSKGKRQKSQSAEPAQSPASHPSGHLSKPSKGLTLTLLILAAAGILLTSYLTYTAWFEDHPAFCTEGSGCDLVQASRWATFLGLPMALWGLLTYLVMAHLIWRGKNKASSGTPLLIVAVCGFAISAYLTTVSIVEIEATCPYCLASFAIITMMMVLAIVRQPPNWTTSLKEAIVIGVLLVGALHLHYSGIFDSTAGPEDPQLQALAIHLTEQGAKFYGAHWCPRCQEQKAVFEASAKRLPYVECSSGGRGSALTKPCLEAKIRSYPTWVVGKHRLTGLQTPRALASASGFDWNE